MTHRRSISAFISGIAVSVVLALAPASVFGRDKADGENKDSVAFFRGFSVSVDLVGPAQLMFSDYGQYEAALHINLKDKYFPVVEVGVGNADHTDDVTQISYKTTAPYWKIGADFNLLKNKHDIYRLFAGVRFAFTSFKYDISHPGVEDPVWGGVSGYKADDVSCSSQWAEFLIGVDAKIWGPLHLGWSLSYRSRISSKEGDVGTSWYVPGFGRTGSSNIGGTFNVSLDI